jgi:FTR1 family protein
MMINTITSFSIVIREGLEAILLLMLFNRAAVTADQRRWVISGALGGIAIPCALAAFAHEWAEINEHTLAIIGNLAAAIVLAYVFFWSRHIMIHVREHVDTMISMSGFAVMVSSWFIVARESTELMLMLMGSYAEDPVGTLRGIMLGAATITALCVGFNYWIQKLNIPRFFQISSYFFGAMSIYYLYEAAEKIVDMLQ